jgi:hypothetical protein
LGNLRHTDLLIPPAGKEKRRVSLPMSNEKNAVLLPEKLNAIF